MRLLPLVTVLLAVAPLSGCFGGDGDPPDPSGTPTDPVVEPQWAVDAIFAGSDPADTDNETVHDLSDRSVHQGLSTPNFIELGWDPLVTGFHGAPGGGYFCGEVSQEGDRRLAVVNSFTSGVAVVVLDVTDSSDPRMVGELVLPRTQIYDSAITDDGRFAVLATSPLAAATHTDGTGGPQAGADGVIGLAERLSGGEATYLEQPYWRDACGNTFQGPEDEVPYYSGTLLVDIRDPTQPAVADFVPAPALGPHSVSSTTVDGVRYVASSITNLAYQASYFQFFQVEELPVLGVGKLVPTSSYSANYAQSDAIVAGDVAGSALLNGHVDATIHKHPVTGDVLAYLANWDGGMLTVDISLPVATLVSTWGDLSTAAGARAGAVHSTLPLEGFGDGNRFYVVVGQEVGGSFNQEGNRRPTGQIVVVDMTDPQTPEPVARWTLPVYVRWSGGLHFSTHYTAVVDDVLYVAMYHGGVWAADLRTEVWPELPSLGVYLPTNDPPAEAASSFGPYAPYVLDVLALEDGSVLVFDASTGAYTLRFDREVPVTPAAPWTEDAWIGS